MSTRNPYPSDVSDDEWAFVAYLTLLPADAGQRHYDLREVYNGLRWMVRTGASLSHDAARPAALVYNSSSGLRQIRDFATALDQQNYYLDISDYLNLNLDVLKIDV